MQSFCLVRLPQICHTCGDNAADIPGTVTAIVASGRYKTIDYHTCDAHEVTEFSNILDLQV